MSKKGQFECLRDYGNPFYVQQQQQNGQSVYALAGVGSLIIIVNGLCLTPR